MESQWDVAERKVLAENTAQAILKHLKRLEEKRTVIGTRWIWELLQNARDAAGPAGVNVSIELNQDELTFRHDGRPFRHEELAHLVYHGTTKLEDEASVGHFGSGFVSTHLLSRRVRVSGSIEAGPRFEFWLDRSSGDQHELADAMQRSMRECRESTERSTPSPGVEGTTFAYPLLGESAVLAYTAIEELRRWAPLVLALATEIASISVQTDSGNWSLKRGEALSLAEGLEVSTIDAVEGTDDVTRHHVAVARAESGAQAAMPLREVEGGFAVGLDGNTPRVFVLFPILGTDKLGFPAVLQSTEFEPVEDRDGIWLSSASETAVKNRAIVESVVPAMMLLVRAAAAQKWRETERVLALDAAGRPDWVDETWLRGLLAGILTDAEGLAMVPTVGEEAWATIRAAWIPMSETDTYQDELWELASGLSASKDRLPPRESAPAWAQNLKSWANLLGCRVREHSAAFTLTRLARAVHDAGSISALAAQLDAPGEVREWLSRFLGLVQTTRQTTLHDELALLPDQRGKLRKRRELALDGGIAEALKEVGAALGVEVRSTLLDKTLDIPGLAGLLAEKSEQHVVDDLIAVIKKACQGGRMPGSMVLSSVELFRWLLAKPEYAPNLDGFPVATADAGEDSCAVVELPRRDQIDARLLAPVAVWPATAAKFAGMFPKRKVLHPEFGRETTGEHWSDLSRRGLVHVGPLFKADVQLEDGLTVEPLTEDAEHRSDQVLGLSSIACLLDKDSGLVDTSRKSRARAVQLIEFLLEHVLPTDAHAFEQRTVACECGQQHRVYGAAWLGPLRRRKWVALENSGQDHATAQSLSALLAERPDLVRGLEAGGGRALLVALGINPAYLALQVIAPDPESQVSLIRSAADLAQATGGVDGVRQLVADIQSDPEILGAIAERKENRERVKRNQGVGALVEQLLREQLEAQGLRVERTGVGSDFEVESDYVEEGGEVVLRLVGVGRPVLLEVKSARSDRVKMTPRQAQTACEQKEGFALCVVPIGEDAPTAEVVRERSRFVFGVGDYLAEAWAAFEEMEAATAAAQLAGGQVELEIIEGQVRFKVGRTLWSSGLGFDAAVAAVAKRAEPAETRAG